MASTTVVTCIRDSVVRVFEIDAPGEDAVRKEGRDVIRSWFLRWGRGGKDANPVHQAKFIRHHLSTCLIEITGPDTARARTPSHLTSNR